MKKNCNVFLASCFTAILSIMNVFGAKDHVNILTITNNTGYSMTDPTGWFESGRLADGWSFQTIPTGTTSKIEMYELDGSPAGCCGYVEYTMNNGRFTIAFSNPSFWAFTIANRINCGVSVGDGNNSVYANMKSHSSPTDVIFSLGGVDFNANIESSDGIVNNARVILSKK